MDACGQDGKESEEAFKRRFIDTYALSKPLVKFFIRHPLDPTGSCSTSLKVFVDTMLERGFDGYHSETYEVPGLRLGEEFSLVKIDLASRMLGKDYYYWEAKFSGLRIHDTE